MENKKKGLLHNRWFIGIFTTAIGSIIAYVAIFTKVGKVILNILIYVKDLIVKFFSISFSIPLWIFILLLIPAIFIIVLIIGFLTERKVSPPKFLNYTQDEFDGIIWRWSWHFDKFFSKKWSIKDLTPFCPKCDCELLSAYPSGFRCPNCHFEEGVYHKLDVELKVIINQRAGKLISQNQNKG